MGDAIGKSDLALIAGGSSGLGLACARLLALRGLSVLVVSRRADALGAAVRESSGTIERFRADLTDPDAIDRLRTHIESQGQRVRWLVNAMDVGLDRPLAETPPSEIETALRTNITAPILVARAFLGHLTTAPGVLCNIVSRAALRGIAGETVYCAGKWGLRGFTEALREELRGRVRVIGIYPGPFDSPFWEPWRGRVAREDWHTFMSTEAVARQVVHAVLDTGEVAVTDLVINRP